MLYTFGQSFIEVNGQMLKNNPAIWSHCQVVSYKSPFLQ